MIIHPDLRALRSDDAPQRDAQEALFAVVGAWRKRPHVAAILADLERFAGTGALSDCPSLAALFDEGAAHADELAAGFAREVSACLEREPLGHVPLRHFTDGTVSTLLLARSGNVTLSLVALDGEGLAARPDPVTVDFSPSEVRERVLAGTARAERIERLSADEAHAELTREQVGLSPGRVIARDALREALLVRRVDGCLVTLRLQRRRTGAGPTCEYRIADGKLVHQAAGNPRDSRVELMMALLGRMGRSDAVPMLAEIALEPGSTALRWQALRECLALDTGRGFAALTEVARSECDELARPAGAFRSQLVESYPQLLEIAACPAHSI